MSIVILGATALANLLVVYELRQSSSISQSTQALFSADAGIERILMRRFGCCAAGCGPICLPEVAEEDGSISDTGQTFKVYKRCSDVDGNPRLCVNPPGAALIERWYAVGKDATGQIVRTLEITFTEQK
ncbi:MAG: hypothetical protein M1586_02065 [Patescibacteria group bacterium]|nr:hypothetical protein [Patescibacteria group bacterium]MCL5262066.1 hypothetical protein [Patescibacteria group bacterium]